MGVVKGEFVSIENVADTEKVAGDGSGFGHLADAHLGSGD
jgi:hypothetical protein